MAEHIATIPKSIEGKMHGNLSVSNGTIRTDDKMKAGDEVTIQFTAYDSSPINDSDLTGKHKWTGWWRRQWRKYRLERTRIDSDGV